MSVKSAPSFKLEQVVDWRAAVISGLVSGVIFFFALMIGRSLVTGGSIWIVPRYIAAMVMGQGVLPPPTTFDPVVVLVGFLLNMVIALIFALILAAIIHEWSLAVGAVVGALYGLGIYIINYYTFSYFFPWFFPSRTWVDIAAHILFGLVAGAVYELLEVERYVIED